MHSALPKYKSDYFECKVALSGLPKDDIKNYLTTKEKIELFSVRNNFLFLGCKKTSDRDNKFRTTHIRRTNSDFNQYQEKPDGAKIGINSITHIC